MTELKLGSIHLRSYTGPVCWKVYRLQRSRKTGLHKEVLIGWLGTLEQALHTALNHRIAEAEAESIHEVIDMIEEFRQEVRDEFSG